MRRGAEYFACRAAVADRLVFKSPDAMKPVGEKCGALGAAFLH
jgi:hypothetical protein